VAGARDWRRRLIIGITGASGAIYGVRLLQACRELGLEVHLCMSKAAELTLSFELDMRAAEVRALAHKAYAPSDVGAAIASGSFRTRGMIIAPCSIRTMAEIATGTTSSALTRAADVVLKERRRLVLAVREAPFSDIHLENMLKLSRMGAVVLPPLPAFYNHPRTIDDLVDHSVSRMLDQFGLETSGVERWAGEMEVGGD
jgi:flavin prenyltransferase